MDDLKADLESKAKEDKPGKKDKKEKDNGFSEAVSKSTKNEIQIKSGEKAEGTSGKSRRKGDKFKL